jgi:hypothetical protein
MGRFEPADSSGETHEGELLTARDWAAAIANADIAADYAGAFEEADIDPLEIEDDLPSLVARRPSRRLRIRH